MQPIRYESNPGDRPLDSKPRALDIGDLSLLIDNCTLRVKGVPLSLTRKEHIILACLMQASGMVTTTATLYERIYHETAESDVSYKIIPVFICKLRKKIRRVSATSYIETAWGRGYSIRGS